MNNQKKLIILVITLSLILIISSSYALLRSTKTSQNNYSISIGDLEVTFIDSQTEKLNLSDMYPMSDEEGESQEDELVFTVENTGTVGTYYDVYIEELSTSPEFKNVIKYISKKDEEEYKEPKVLSENEYIEITGYLESQQTSTYKVKVWLMEEADSTYMGKEFKAKIVVNSYQNNYAKDIVKSKLVKYEESSKDTFTGGLVAVNTIGELYNETDKSQTIREYRYSGPIVNNYVYFNCKDDAEQNASNCETWRIIGVFKDESGQEHIKIVRNEVLNRDVFPDSYTAAGKTFYIRYPYSSSNFVFWDYDGENSLNYNNNWEESGLMNWLNSTGTENGYLKTLSTNAQNMITKTKYYLGTLTYGGAHYLEDTAVQAYNYERMVSGCIDGKGPSTSDNKSAVEGNSNCRVWANNAAYWEGEIALMYPSDYGFSANSKYWKTILGYNSFETPSNTSWLQISANHTIHEWLLSPTSGDFNFVSLWDTTGFLSYMCAYAYGLRATLYLKSDVQIIGGIGTSSEPYQLLKNA